MESEKYCFNAAKYIGEGCTGEQKMENDILEIYLGAAEYFECHVNGFWPPRAFLQLFIWRESELTMIFFVNFICSSYYAKINLI